MAVRVAPARPVFGSALLYARAAERAERIHRRFVREYLRKTGKSVPLDKETGLVLLAKAVEIGERVCAAMGLPRPQAADRAAA